MKIDLRNLTIKKAHDAMKNGEYTAVDLAQAYLEVIKEKNTNINAYLEVFDDVIDQAKKADEIFKAGKATLLTGIPFSIKDNILIQGRRAGSASKILEGYIAPYDATAIKKLKEHHAVFLGRVNMDEFAMGGSTENSAYGVTKNPIDETRVSGGSSGGSAGSVAMDGSLVSLGSDTGGSVRQPGAFCGVVGLKPTYGRVSRHGLMAMGSSLDQIGPIGKSVEDVKIVLDAIKGADINDSTTYTDEVYPVTSPKKSYSIGIPKDFLEKGGIAKDVKENFEKIVENLKNRGHEIVYITLPYAEYSLPVYYIIMPAEVSSNMSRFDGVRFGAHKEGASGIDDYFVTRGEGFGREVQRRILLGTYVLSAGYYDSYYGRALAVRKAITKDYEDAFKKVDIIMTPTTPAPAFKIGEKTSDPVAMYLEDIFTVTANLTGMPAITIPSGTVDRDGVALPLGVQFTGRMNDEDVLFDIGRVAESF